MSGSFTEAELKSALKWAFDNLPDSPKFLAVDWRMLPWNSDAAKVAEIAERRIKEGFGKRQAEIRAMVDETNARLAKLNGGRSLFAGK